VRVNGAVGLARRHAADDVADGDAVAPFFFASRSAASVSAVSPDCVITIASVFSTRSDRGSGIRTVVHVDRHARQRFEQNFPTSAECQDVPHARMTMRSTWRST
jgi:hypothetical protein